MPAINATPVFNRYTDAWNVSIPAGTSLGLVGMFYPGAGAFTASVGATTADLERTEPGGTEDWRLGILSAVEPSSGSQTVTRRVGGSWPADIHTAFVSVSGSDTDSPIRASNGAQGESTSPGVTVSSVAGDLCVAVLCVMGTVTPTGGDLVEYGSEDGRTLVVLAKEATGASTSLGCTIDTGYWYAVGVSIIPGGDSDPPTLTSPTATATGQTTASLSVTVDSTADVYTVVTTSATAPTDTQVMAGQDHTGAAAAFADDEEDAEAGSVPFTATGLAPDTTYYAHFVADNEDGTSDVVTSSSFTTDEIPVLVADGGDLVLEGGDATFLVHRLITANGADLVMEGGDITLTLISEGSISSVVTLGGDPVQGATVRLYDMTADVYVGDTLTDENGVYTFTELQLSHRYHASVEYEDEGTLYNAPSQPFLEPVAD